MRYGLKGGFGSVCSMLPMCGHGAKMGTKTKEIEL